MSGRGNKCSLSSVKPGSLEARAMRSAASVQLPADRLVIRLDQLL